MKEEQSKIKSNRARFKSGKEEALLTLCKKINISINNDNNIQELNLDHTADFTLETFGGVFRTNSNLIEHSMKGIKGSATHLKLRPVFKGHLISHLEKKKKKERKNLYRVDSCLCFRN